MSNKVLPLRRVVITGIGLVSPVGIGTEETWKNLVAGVSGAAAFDPKDHEGFPVQFGCQVKKFDVSRWIEPRAARRLDRFVHFSVAAANLAKENAKLNLETLDRDRCGVVFASGIGGILSVEEQLMKFTQHGPRRISPFSVPMLMINGGCGQLAIEFGFRGLNYATVSACASSNHALGLAFRHIQVGDADLVVSGGSEAGIGIMGLGGFSNMHALSSRNDDPAHASRPFDKNRDGFVIGEGAAAIILEELEHAKKRGATIIAEFLGYGFTDDATHITAPAENGEMLAKAMQIAMQMGEIAPEEIDYVNAHGTSTEFNDRAETAALKGALGAHAYKIAISSTKSCTGHMLGAAGGFELGVSALAIKNGIVPPTINYETPDPNCDLNYTPNHAIKKKIRFAMSNSCGFGGHNATLLIGEYRE